MDKRCYVREDQTIVLGNHIACDGETKESESGLIISHVHKDHFKEAKVNSSQTGELKAPLIISEGTRDLLIPGSLLGIAKNNEGVKVLKFNEPYLFTTMNGEEVKITLMDAGHMLGSSQIQIEEEDGTRYGYSGDFNGNLNDFIDVDILVLDATNGVRPDTANWDEKEAFKRLWDGVHKAHNLGKNTAICAAPGLLQYVIEDQADFLNDVEMLLTYEFDEIVGKSLVKEYSKVYASNRYNQPEINSYVELQNSFEPEEMDIVFNLPNMQKTILAHNTKQIGPLGGHTGPENFDGVLFEIKNFVRNNDAPIHQVSENHFIISLSSHAIGDKILEYVKNVNPELVITDSSRRDKCSVSLAKKIQDELRIEAIPSSDLLKEVK